MKDIKLLQNSVSLWDIKKVSQSLLTFVVNLEGKGTWAG
ncbi:hypothetical protein M23134_04539 [Microscilla marina ATCC 23134]|uniref:Uncharacterized protein n=1 Tax=Microscilla marina ATCC 23134 TaxID=313606 RepID=A1ZWC0_MICM2|nr:hypothetical protein M23134_04539 [Microscilla marina ATCC 23134]